MTRDLEETLNELGPSYREMVGRMKAAYEPLPHPAMPVGYLCAASLLVVLAFGAFMRPQKPRSQAPASNAYLLAHLHGDEALQEIIRTQRADGSWQTDFLTRQNADVLKRSSDKSAQIAYRKAMRNLRLRGVL